MRNTNFCEPGNCLRGTLYNLGNPIPFPINFVCCTQNEQEVCVFSVFHAMAIRTAANPYETCRMFMIWGAPRGARAGVLGGSGPPDSCHSQRPVASGGGESRFSHFFSTYFSNTAGRSNRAPTPGRRTTHQIRVL